MKKYVALALALVLVLSLCACGAKKEEETYTPTDTDTVAVGAVVIARDDVPEDEIYDFVSAIFENTAPSASSTARARSWTSTSPLP